MNRTALNLKETMNGYKHCKQSNSTVLPLVIFFFALLLSSCASLSEEECLNADWHAIGYSDGVSGHYPDHIMDHQKACGKFGVSPDHRAWEAGRKEGLQHYCTKANAYNLGERGESLHAVCPPKMAEELQFMHDKGMMLYKRDQQIEEDRRLLREYRDELQELKKNKDGSSSEKDYKRRMRDLDDKIYRLERRINQDYYDGEYPGHFHYETSW